MSLFFRRPECSGPCRLGRADRRMSEHAEPKAMASPDPRKVPLATWLSRDGSYRPPHWTCTVHLLQEPGHVLHCVPMCCVRMIGIHYQKIRCHILEVGWIHAVITALWHRAIRYNLRGQLHIPVTAGSTSGPSHYAVQTLVTPGDQASQSLKHCFPISIFKTLRPACHFILAREPQ
jgi:hypothetical protein